MSWKTAKSIRRKVFQMSNRIQKKAIDDFIAVAIKANIFDRVRFCVRILKGK
jgi:hypothetical protein